MQLVELFGSTRDAWMAEDLDDWLGANEIYEGVPAIVQNLRKQGSFYIVTTKQVCCFVVSLTKAVARQCREYTNSFTGDCCASHAAGCMFKQLFTFHGSTIQMRLAPCRRASQRR